MEEVRDLYVMISETDTGVGRIIRSISEYRYNHVSVTMDPTFRLWYSFARFRENAPFLSGYVREPVERFLARGEKVPVRIFRLELAKDRARKLEQLFQQAGDPDTQLLYNYYDALAAILRKKISIPGSYTCLAFACAILEKDYITIEALNEDLQDHLIYDGELGLLAPDSGDRQDPYFSHLGVLPCFLSTAWAMARVTRRLFFGSDRDLIQDRLHRHAQ